MTGLIILPLLSLLAGQAATATAVVLHGRPTVQIDSADDLTTRTELPAAASDKLAVRIVRKGDRYYWASRDNQELTRRVSGAFQLFTDPASGGYVRVFDTSTLPQSLQSEGPQFRYIEHVPLFKGTVTYFGGADTFEE
jgi:hypothetical protein